MTDGELTGLARWEDRFSKPGYRFGTEPSRFLAANAGLVRPGMAALSVADGEGRNGVWLAQQGCAVTTVDFSPTGIGKAEALAAERGVAINAICADIVEWDWPEGAFDLVVGIFFQFLNPEQRASVFARIDRALRPGGVLLLEGYGLKQLEYKTGGPNNAAHLYTEALIRDAFTDYGRLEVTEYETEMTEGEGHVGMSALVDVVGVK